MNLDKTEARQFAQEVEELHKRSQLPDLDSDLSAVAEAARWCARASGKAWLRIEKL